MAKPVHTDSPRISSGRSQRERETAVTVLGSIFIDLIYRQPFTQAASRPVRQQHGGIGRNIAENLGWIGLRPQLVSLITPDDCGFSIATALAHAGVRLCAKLVPDGVGVFQAFVPAGEVEEYASAQPALSELDWAFVNRHIRRSRFIVTETGMDLELLRRLSVACKQRKSFVYGVPTRIHELSAEHQREALAALDAVVMNRQEAELIVQGSIRDGADAVEAAADLQRRGPRHVVITLGAAGASAAAPGVPPALFASNVSQVENTLGCGDAFTAAMVAASAFRVSFSQAIGFALELAARTSEVSGPVAVAAAARLGTTLRAVRRRSLHDSVFTGQTAPCAS